MIFEGLGACGTTTATRFNGFGPRKVEPAETLARPATGAALAARSSPAA